MTPGLFSDRDRKALLRGGLVVVAALLYTFGIKPSRERRALLLEQVEAERALLARELPLAAKAAAQSPMSGATTTSQLFTGSDAVIASSALATYIAAEAEQHDVWLQQATTMSPARNRTRPASVEVSLRAESDLQGLLRLLSALEGGRMLVQVHTLDVRAGANDLDDGTAPLAISAVVRSAALPGGTAPDAATRTGGTP